ncbi:BREX-2 system adenine-specific DNA-methyltransferase PglX [Luteococcus sediminum]
MTATSQLTTDLKALVLRVEDDLRRRLAEDANLTKQWQDEHREANKAERSAAAWETFRDDRLTQAAVSWVLTTVFIRFCEDNALLSPVWVAGPPERRQEALDAENAFFREFPTLTYREWILQGIKHLTALPATKGLVAPPAALNLIAPSGDMAGEVLQFWRRRTSDGELVHDLRDESLSTRFLGDLYQDLSEYAKKTFALLQTPVFVEEFILDQTLTPALAERPLEGFTLIDPTCGSGHFLLGAFDRFVALWREQEPDLPDDEVVRRALASVHGVDINGFAVAIARFRLTVAALQAMGRISLEDAPELDLNLAAGDSLLSYTQDTLVEDENLFSFETEDTAALARILQPRQYDVVVGNPPYITVKDKALNQLYRSIYKTCKGTYALTVPFMERFFQLAKPRGGPAGWVGQITSNSFMKREFGSKLIEEFLAQKDLRLVVDTSGAYIPGHGTPTVIIVGRHELPTSSAVRTVLGVRGEPGQPADPSQGRVWREIVEHLAGPGHDGEFVTVDDLDRKVLATHPWSLTGGAASSVTRKLDESPERLASTVDEIGRTTHTGADDAYFLPATWPSLHGLKDEVVPVVLGEEVRDFALDPEHVTLFPYDEDGQPRSIGQHAGQMYWRNRQVLRMQLDFGRTKEERGLRWQDHSMFFPKRFRARYSITFAFVATHNHFVLDRGGKVFKQSAPVIKLPADATEDEHLALLGVLNSSTACFWLKQNSHKKTAAAMGGGMIDEPWSNNWEFTGTTLKDLPLPSELPLERGRSLDRLAKRWASQQPDAVVLEAPTAGALDAAHRAGDQFRSEMVAAQEELDWWSYRAYGLCDEDLNYHGEPPTLQPGERAFAIVLARQVEAGEASPVWFTHWNHHHTPVTEIPAHWPEEYRALVQRRIDLIESDKAINLLERPEYKRRWASELWEKKQEKALRNWLLDRLESREYWFDAQGRPAPRSVNELADLVGRDTELVEVLRLWEGRAGVLPSESLRKLLVPEVVPYLAALRLKDTGMRKFEAWKKTWELQRQEDAGVEVGTIPVPPKYTSGDFRKTEWWQARGKLDVPKERFILYPDAGRSTDTSELLGRAGWNHLEQALALGIIIGTRQAEGWDEERLVPLVAGLAELQPWVEQWHADYDPTYGMSMAEFTREQLRQRSQQVDKTLDELDAWRPAPTTRGRKPRA